MRDEWNGFELKYTAYNAGDENFELNGALDINEYSHMRKSSSIKTSPVNFPLIRWVNNLVGSLR